MSGIVLGIIIGSTGIAVTLSSKKATKAKESEKKA